MKYHYTIIRMIKKESKPIQYCKVKKKKKERKPLHELLARIWRHQDFNKTLEEL